VSSHTVKSASAILQAWQNAMASPATAQKYTAGVNAVTDSPTAKAASADAQQRYIQGTQAAVSSGRMASALNAVSLSQWKQQATNVGASRLASGAQKGASKYQAALQKWQPIYQQASDAAAALPKGGFANAQARWSAAVQVMMTAAGSS
jgi:hypothetical protein